MITIGDILRGITNMSFFGLLGVLFIGLKLTNVITWSWWFVLMPVYIPAIIVLCAFLFGLWINDII